MSAKRNVTKDEENHGRRAWKKGGCRKEAGDLKECQEEG